jgi:hypothetical protein
MKSRLLSRKSASRENIEPRWFSLVSRSQRLISSAKDATKVAPMKAKKAGPIPDSAKACTEDSTPDRVRNVPKITRAKVRTIKTMFHRLSMPFFSWTITECKKAVPVSHGMNAAISTGSQPQ